jgi:L-iditol 2-dehydrogenase
MKAVMKVAPGVGNIALQDIDEPGAAAGQVKIKVHSAGLCGTDLHIYKDEFRSKPPVVLGHEVSGEIVEVGQGVPTVRPGDRVTTETYFSTCGMCRYCRSGQTNLCLDRLSIGSAVNGGFTQYLVVPAANIHRLPPTVSFEAGALTEPLACVVHGVLLNAPTVAAGDTAVIAGPGTIGLLTLQVLKSAGATVVALGTNADEQRLALAQELGADYALNIQQEEPLSLVQAITDEGMGADVVYECSGAGPAAQQLLELVRRRGRYVQIGLFGRPVGWDLDQLCYKELTATGSNASTPESWLRAIQLMAKGIVQTEPLITHKFDVTDWQEAFNHFEQKKGVKMLLQPVG